MQVSKKSELTDKGNVRSPNMGRMSDSYMRQPLEYTTARRVQAHSRELARIAEEDKPHAGAMTNRATRITYDHGQFWMFRS